MEIFTKEKIVEDLTRLGVKNGDLLNVKVSYRSIGKIEGGVKTVIEALLEAVGPNGTIFSDSFVSPFPKWKLIFNPHKCLVDNTTKSYAGAVANVMINYPQAKRSPHPIQKFVAIGKDADIVLNHTKDSKPYSVLYELTKLGGKNIRIGPKEKVVGVGTTHCAIEELQWKQNIPKIGVCYKDDNNQLHRFYHQWPTACADAFNNLLPLHKKYGAFINEGYIGNAEAILSDMKATFDMELLLGRSFPNFLRCSDKSCRICHLNWKDSPKYNLVSVVYHNVKRRKFKRILLILYMYLFRNYQPKSK